MNEKELNSLLEKYYSGGSTVEEEKLLREFFTGENVPEAYEAEKEIFAHYKMESLIPEPSHDFEERIMAGIKSVENPGKSFNPRGVLYPFIGIAASILIVAGFYFFFAQKENLRDTYSDPKIAYLETRKILFGVSSKMNRASQRLQPVEKMSQMTSLSFAAINKSNGIIEKNLKSLKILKIGTEKTNEAENKNN
jgi:hypothetical protein